MSGKGRTLSTFIRALSLSQGRQNTSVSCVAAVGAADCGMVDTSDQRVHLFLVVGADVLSIIVRLTASRRRFDVLLVHIQPLRYVQRKRHN